MDVIADPALIVERTLVMSATILAFGFLSIGGLWLWRRQQQSAAGTTFDTDLSVVERNVSPSTAAEKMLELRDYEVPKAYSELASKLEQLALGLDPQRISVELHQRQVEQISEIYRRQTEQVADVVRRMDEIKRLSELHSLDNTLAKSGSR